MKDDQSCSSATYTVVQALWKNSSKLSLTSLHSLLPAGEFYESVMLFCFTKLLTRKESLHAVAMGVAPVIAVQ